MKTEKINLRFGLLACIVLIAALSRMLPHPPNFTPVGAIALFGAAYFSNRIVAFAIPLIALWISDLFINNIIYSKYYDHFVWLYKGFYWNYGSFILIGILGLFLLKKIKPLNVLFAGLSASFLFFTVSNFGVWLGSSFYPQTFSGLITCYVAGIPFFGNTLAGDLFYSGILFGFFELAKYKFPVLSRAKL